MDIYEIQEALSFKEKLGYYSGVFCTGKFDCIYDYDYGIVELKIENK